MNNLEAAVQRMFDETKEFHICRCCGCVHPVRQDDPIPTLCRECAACSWIITKQQLTDTVDLLRMADDTMRLRAGRYLLTRVIRRRATYGQ